MDHRYIDDHSVTERYLEHSLSPVDRAKFEAHLVDCQECVDRILLAQMFHNGKPTPRGSPAVFARAAAGKPPESGPEAGPAKELLRVRFVRRLTAWQLFLILSVAAGLLVLVPSLLLLWILRH